MREIIFRGKDIHSGKWVEGNLILYKEPVTAKTLEGSFKNYYRIKPFDVAFEEYEVDPKTIGQWTGETDKNGVKIFEGDILKIEYENLICYVKYIEDCFYIVGPEPTKLLNSLKLKVVLEILRHGTEVVDNVHDNPEMLGRYKLVWIKR